MHVYVPFFFLLYSVFVSVYAFGFISILIHLFTFVIILVYITEIICTPLKLIITPPEHV